VLRERLNSQAGAALISDFRNKLVSAEAFDAIRIVEANAAACYFREWRYIHVTWPKADLPKIPDHWRFAGSRQSPLTGGPRLAVTPVHAILNYCFALLEAETRLAVSALGLDPGLGVGLHTDTANRDSLALDVLEPARPQIEAWLLNWIASEPLRRSDFFETATGNCRLMSHLCREDSTASRLPVIISYRSTNLCFAVVCWSPPRGLSTASEALEGASETGGSFVPVDTESDPSSKLAPGLSHLGDVNLPRLGSNLVRNRAAISPGVIPTPSRSVGIGATRAGLF
jgi:hypothetical protein